jgi:sugar (pentulose or hexulose) kinase
VKRGRFVVVDMGKTLSKVSLWSNDGEMLDRQVRPNERPVAGGVPRLDATGIEKWLVGALSKYSGEDVSDIFPVGHGAGVAAIIDGQLAFPPLDYEYEIPAGILRDYRGQRDAFALTGSPALSEGLNLGAQLHFLETLHPQEMEKATLLPWAQYWAWVLSGVAASEVTSLGCHTDLWSPDKRDYSPLAQRRGWAGRFAPLQSADAVLGNLSSKIVSATGLPASASVRVGIHDSNAALVAAQAFPAIERSEATVLSTGTWFVGMRLTAEKPCLSSLPEERDCLANVDFRGQTVPSGRFMGGREIETIIGIDTRRVDIKPDQPALLAAVARVLKTESMLLPSLAPGFGPYPGATGHWENEPHDWFERRAAACLYAALVADKSLDLIGSKDILLIEGRFAEAEVFVRALASLRSTTRIFTANAHNDVSFGALRLILPDLKPRGELMAVAPLPEDISLYRDKWRLLAEQPFAGAAA